jgi:acetyl-CoA carboxylase carboxyltransferase component
MSVEGAVDIIHRKEIAAASDPDVRRRELIAETRERLGPLRAVEHFHLDEVIDPRDTRSVLIRTLEESPARRAARGWARVRPISPI